MRQLRLLLLISFPPLVFPLLLFPLGAHAQWEGHEIVAADIPYRTGDTAFAKTVDCPAGKVVISGGYSLGVPPGDDLVVAANGPNFWAEGSGWVVSFHRAGGPAGRLYTYAVCVNAQQTCSPGGDTSPEVTPTGALLFDGFSDTALAQWVGKSEGAHSGSVVTDPLNSGNKALLLAEVVPAGDMFSSPIDVTPGVEYALCFKYMGRPVSSADAGNGGAIGIAAGTPGNHRWLAGTYAAGGIEKGILEDDGQWQSYRVTFYPLISGSPVSSLRIMLEDFTGTGGDVYFDDIKLVPATQGC